MTAKLVEGDGRVREGLAEALPIPKPAKDGKSSTGERAEVFYNPAQVFNRDLSVLVLSVFGRLRSKELEEAQERRRQKAAKAEKAPSSSSRPAPPLGLVVFEALAATGIRSIRYAKELGPGTRPAAEGIRKIVANDLEPSAVAHMRRNLEHNEVSSSLVEVSCDDANGHMYSRRARGPGSRPELAYDVIDLDPYGSCSPFLDAAVQAVVDGGLLLITSTDMPVLGGNNPETCFSRYGGTALKAGYLHEMALRLVLNAVSATAARFGREAQPVLSCSIDFYVRCFVRIFDSPARVKRLASKTAVVHQCVQCESFSVQPLGECSSEDPNEATAAGSATTSTVNAVEGDDNGSEDKAANNTKSHRKEQQSGSKKEKKDRPKPEKFKAARVIVPGSVCPECNGRVKLGGPFYSGPLFDPSFVETCLEACSEDRRDELPGVTSWRKIEGMLTAISEEHPELALFYKLPSLCRGLKLPPVSLKQFRGTLQSLGYKACHFHREPEAVKTDAPNAVVYDLMRLWAEENPPTHCPLPDLLKKEFTLKRPIEWTVVSEEVTSKPAKVARFLPNPESHWGPKRAARMGGYGAAETDAAAAASTSSTSTAVSAAATSDER
mmetsp:Transcript_46901/g.100422  ORF Transcript_46901/g.100422 Transcript_46901/m.100422 type:complete len:608 (-) Transcript_46901:24-1847(-)